MTECVCPALMGKDGVVSPPPVKMTLYKRWRLLPEVDCSTVVSLVRDRIVPHYARLDPAARLELEQVDERTLLTIQRWPSRRRYEKAISGDQFDRWWQQYVPILEEWETMLEFDAEWEGSVLLD